MTPRLHTSFDGEHPSRTVIRPKSARRRVRGRLQRLWIARRRAATAAGLGLLAAGSTILALSALRPLSEPVIPEASPPESDTSVGATASTREPVLDDNQRILALDRSAVVLPVEVGSSVELVGLRQTVIDVETEVIAERAEVAAVTDQAVLLIVGAEAARTATEVAAMGQLAVLGRDHPNN